MAPSSWPELNEFLWSQLKNDLRDVEPQEVEWRPLPQANNLNDIVRHLRIEAQWQLASIENSQPMLLEATPPIQTFIDSIPFDFERNRSDLEELCIRFLAVLRSRSLAAIEQQNLLVYHTRSGFVQLGGWSGLRPAAWCYRLHVPGAGRSRLSGVN